MVYGGVGRRSRGLVSAGIALRPRPWGSRQSRRRRRLVSAGGGRGSCRRAVSAQPAASRRLPAQASTNFAPWLRAAAERDPEAAERSRDLLFPNRFEVPQEPREAPRWGRAAAEPAHAGTQAHTGLNSPR